MYRQNYKTVKIVKNETLCQGRSRTKIAGLNLMLILTIGMQMLSLCHSNAVDGEWGLYVERPDQAPVLVNDFTFGSSNKVSFGKEVVGFTVTFNADSRDGYWYYSADVSSRNDGAKCYLSLVKKYDARQAPFNFFGQVTNSGIYRQSPHEPGDHHFFDHCLMQGIPMVALKDGNGFEVALCDTPAFYDNYTSQTYDLKNRNVKLASGDNGLVFEDGQFQVVPKLTNQVVRQEEKLFRIEPHYFAVSSNAVHHMDGLYIKIKGTGVRKLRESVNLAISKHWSNGRIVDLLGSALFSSAYMNLRVNETGKSKYWVIPAISYSNKQYTRDAFYMSMILPYQYSKFCFENEEKQDGEFTGAERQLCVIIWAYRNYEAGYKIDPERLREILARIEEHVTNGYYLGYMKGTANDGCFQGLMDLLAFEKDDTLTHNQGLFVVALMCASKMGMEPKTSIALAQQNYRNLFNPKISAFPLSRQKITILDINALMGDLLAQVYFGKRLLGQADVLAHYETLKKYSKTQFGFKCVANPDGSYLTKSEYRSKSFESGIQNVMDGEYQCGGSWYLYDMLMLMDAYLDGAKDAEDLMIWRTKLEFAAGDSTHEFINTITGAPHQPNMGWNAAVYGLWSEIIRQGKASNRLFSEIDKLRDQ